ncbi:MAG: YlbF family regulator [Anaerolineales bacterium]|nr:YlbF family regulator [Anaerolineales bacterium]
MNSNPSQLDVPVLTTFEDRDSTQIAQSLGKILLDTPEYQTFLNALNEVNNNVEVRRISLQMREHDTALKWGKGDPDEHRVALEQLNQEMENLSCLRAYRHAENVIVSLCRQLDQVISQAAGIEFAPNARRSSCGCGG